MTKGAQDKDRTPTPEKLRHRVQDTRDELGRTVEELAAKADVKAQTKEKVTVVRARIHDSAEHATAQAREAAGRLARAAQEKTPEPVREKAAQAGTQVAHGAAAVADKVHEKTPEAVGEQLGRASQAARRRRGPLLAVAVSALALLAIRRSRKHR